MRLAMSLLAVALFSSHAVADSAPSPSDPSSTRQTEERIAVALAVNAPVGWGRGFGLSGYLGFGKRHAVRFNFARWSSAPSPVMPVVAALAGADYEDEASYSGQIGDLSVGYQFYSRRLFEGLTLEVGALRRDVNKRVEAEAAFPNIRETKAVGYAARALVGWSWLYANRLLVATAAGASYGRYAGTKRDGIDNAPDPVEYMTRDFVDYDIAFEAYLRIGLAFGT